MSVSLSGNTGESTPDRHAGMIASPMGKTPPCPVGPWGATRPALHRSGLRSPARPRVVEGASKVSQKAAAAKPHPGPPIAKLDAPEDGGLEVPEDGGLEVPEDGAPPVEVPEVSLPVVDMPLREGEAPAAAFAPLHPQARAKVARRGHQAPAPMARTYILEPGGGRARVPSVRWLSPVDANQERRSTSPASRPDVRRAHLHRRARGSTGVDPCHDWTCAPWPCSLRGSSFRACGRVRSRSRSRAPLHVTRDERS